MKATAFEFRWRVAILTVIIVLGYWAPWIRADATGSAGRIPLMEAAMLDLTRLGLLPFSAATQVVIVFGALLAAVGAALRIWGTAYLGAATVFHGQMQVGLQANGPYRYVRNPLYLGSWFMFAAMALLMPVTGALFAMVLVTVFQLRLIFGEEAFLSGRLGESYAAYLKAVPRLLPRLRANLPRSEAKPRWGRAALAELNPIGIFLIFAALSWSYDNGLMIRAVIVSYGISLVARALLPAERS